MEQPLKKTDPELETPATWNMQYCFIDWIKISAENNGRWPVMNDGCIISITPDGEIEYETARHMSIEGSHDSKSRFRVTTEALEFNFNPSRFNRPDNLYGCTYGQAIQVINRILDTLGLKPVREFNLLRVDVTLNVKTGSVAKLEAYVRQLKRITLPRRKPYNTYDSAIHANGHSKLTIYQKYSEMAEHNDTMKSYFKRIRAAERDQSLTKLQKQGVIQNVHSRVEKSYAYRLYQHCKDEGLARVELRLQRDYLRKNGLRKGHEATHQDFVNVFIKETSQMPKESTEETLEGLSRPHLGTLLQWKAGIDPRKLVCRQTFYKHRNAILKATGIDIGGPMPTRLEPKKSVQFKTEAAVPPNFYIMPLQDDDYSHLELVTE